MAYTVKLPPVRPQVPDPPAVSPYPETPVTPVTSGDVARLLKMPLDRFEREGCLLEVRVPWLEPTLWFVPTEADAEALAREGVSRGRVWTARELVDLLEIPGLTQEQTKSIAQVKATLDGHVVEVRPR